MRAEFENFGDRSMEAQQRLERFETAMRKMETADYSTALAEFEFLESLSEHPSDIALLRLYQTSCLTEMGKKREARNRIGAIEKNQLGSVVQIGYEYEYARIMRADGNLQIALDLTRDALKAVQDDKTLSRPTLAMNLNTLLGILLAQTGTCDEAIEVLQRVPIEDPGWAEARVCLGDCRYKKRLYREAISDYESVISCGTGVHPIFLHAAIRNTGFALYDLDDYAKAIDYLVLIKDKYEEYPALKNEVSEILTSAYSKLEQSGIAQEHLSRGSRLLQ
jgi:tetratricopeptide (TPR) repeat protein